MCHRALHSHVATMPSHTPTRVCHTQGAERNVPNYNVRRRRLLAVHWHCRARGRPCVHAVQFAVVCERHVFGRCCYRHHSIQYLHLYDMAGHGHYGETPALDFALPRSYCPRPRTAQIALVLYFKSGLPHLLRQALLIVGSSLTILFAAFYAYLKTDKDSPLIEATSWKKIRSCLGMPPIAEPENATP